MLWLQLPLLLLLLLLLLLPLLLCAATASLACVHLLRKAQYFDVPMEVP